MFTTTYLASGWYEEFLKWIPEGEIFNLRVVFEAIPGILKELPNTILLTLAGAFFGLLLALLFAIVKINRVKILYPIQALFVSFLRGTPILVQLMLTYYGIPLLLKAINQQYGTAFNINDVPAHLFVIVAFAFNEAAYASETIRAAILSVDAGEIEAAKSLGMKRPSLSSDYYSKCSSGCNSDLDQLFDWFDQGDFSGLLCRCFGNLCPSQDYVGE